MAIVQKQFLFLLSIQFFIGLSSPLPMPVQRESVNEGNLKHYVSLQSDESHRCGAVLLDKNIALVAAHCLYDQEKNLINRGRLRIVAGIQSRDGSGPHKQTGTVQTIRIHHDFNINSNTHENENDIALIRIQGNGFELNEHVHKVHVVSPRPQNFTGSTVVTSGFSGSRDQLKDFKTKVISNFKCNQMLLEGNGNGNGVGVSSSMICTHVNAQSAVCPEDSGVPLIYMDQDGRNKIIGIVAREGGCARNQPTVFTRISAFEGWIRNNFNQLLQNA